MFEQKKPENNKSKQSNNQASSIAIQLLFDSTMPMKQCDKQIFQYPIQNGFQKNLNNPRSAFVKPVKLSKNGPIVKYQILQKQFIIEARNVQNFMSETLRSLNQQCKQMIQDIKQLMKIEQERQKQYLYQKQKNLHL